MRDITHVDQKTSDLITNMLKSDPDKEKEIEAAQKKEAKEIVKYYQENFDFVQLVTCTTCGSDLCLWVLDREQVQPNLVNHHLGLRRIVIGNALLSTRKRLDGAMGYHCAGQITNPKYAENVKEVTAFNEEQDRLEKAKKPHEAHRQVTEPATLTCNADTRLSPIEKGILKEEPWHGGTVPAIEPHIEAKIKQKIIATNFQPDVQDLDNGDMIVEGFHNQTIKK